MSKEKQIIIDEYRKRHKRCKTCIYAFQQTDDRRPECWWCDAKSIRHIGSVGESGLRGCFCRLYKAREFKIL